MSEEELKGLSEREKRVKKILDETVQDRIARAQTEIKALREWNTSRMAIDIIKAVKEEEE